MSRIFLTAFLVATFFSGEIYAQFSGGSGTVFDPYQISSVEELQAIKNHPENFFVQVNDINASETNSWNEGKGFEPIGSKNSPFTGHYDGANFYITGLTINRDSEEYVGLFGHIQRAEIKHVLLKEVSISGANITGSLVGQSINSAVIHSFAHGKVTGRTYVGGLVGFNHGEIDRSGSEVEVNGRSYTGGISGINRGLVIRSYSKGFVTGIGNSLGGLIGNNYDGTIIQSYSEANVSGDRVTSLGGLAGSNGGVIEQSYALGNITGQSYIGGLVGNNNGGKILWAYSKGEVSGFNLVGGLAGVNRNNAEIREAYTTSPVTGTIETGGFIGTNRSPVHAGYWSVETSNKEKGVGNGNSESVSNLDTVKMTGPESTQHMNGFSFHEIWGALPGDTPQFLWSMPYFLIDKIEINTPIYSGELAILEITLINAGGLADTNNVFLKNSDGMIIDYIESRILKPGQKTSFFFNWQTSLEDRGSYEFTLETQFYKENLTINVLYVPGEVTLKEPITLDEHVSLKPLFSWNRADRANSYQLQISSDQRFTNILHDISGIDTTQYRLTKPLNHLTDYFWRLRGINSEENGKWSEFLSFTTIIESPETVELFLPEHESSEVPTSPVFSWSTSERAEDYILQLALEEEFEEVLFDTSVTAPDTSYNFEKRLQPGRSIFWRVKATNIGGDSDWSEVFTFVPLIEPVEKRNLTHFDYSLQQNYPNPFNPVTYIRYSIPEGGEVTIEVLNMLGQTVATLVDEYKSAGWHTVVFDASELSSGFYIYRIKTKDFVDSKKFSLVK